MKGFASKTDSMARPSTSLPNSNLNGGSRSSIKGGLSGTTTAQGDGGAKSLRGGAQTLDHTKHGSNTVASPPGGTLAVGERKGPPGSV